MSETNDNSKPFPMRVDAGIDLADVARMYYQNGYSLESIRQAEVTGVPNEQWTKAVDSFAADHGFFMDCPHVKFVNDQMVRFGGEDVEAYPKPIADELLDRLAEVEDRIEETLDLGNDPENLLLLTSTLVDRVLAFYPYNEASGATTSVPNLAKKERRLKLIEANSAKKKAASESKRMEVAPISHDAKKQPKGRKRVWNSRKGSKKKSVGRTSGKNGK